jgi:hypothetical protein
MELRSDTPQSPIQRVHGRQTLSPPLFSFRLLFFISSHLACEITNGRFLAQLSRFGILDLLNLEMSRI